MHYYAYLETHDFLRLIQNTNMQLLDIQNESPLLEAALSNLGTSLSYILTGLPLESLRGGSS